MTENKVNRRIEIIASRKTKTEINSLALREWIIRHKRVNVVYEFFLFVYTSYIADEINYSDLKILKFHNEKIKPMKIQKVNSGWKLNPLPYLKFSFIWVFKNEVDYKNLWRLR